MNKNFPFKKDDIFFLDEITSLCTETDSAGGVFILEKKAEMHLKKLGKLGFFREKINYQLGYVIQNKKAYLVAKPKSKITDEELLYTFQQQINTLIEDVTFILEASKSNQTPLNMIDQKNLKQEPHLKGGATKINNEIIYKDHEHLIRLENLEKLLKKEDLYIFNQTYSSIKNSGPELIKKTSSEEHVSVELFLASLEYWSTKKLPLLKFWPSAESVGVETPSVSFYFHEGDLFGNKTLKDLVLMMCLPPEKRPPIHASANVFKKFDFKKSQTVLDKIDIIQFT